MSISLATLNTSLVKKVYLEKYAALFLINAIDNADPSKKLTLRVHDECNGSDVFGNIAFCCLEACSETNVYTGSDICTCRPYLIYGIEECAKQAQQGGVGVIVYCNVFYYKMMSIELSIHFFFSLCVYS